MSLAGKVAVVTGASRGIGRGIALQLGKAGAKVYITGRQPDQSFSHTIGELPSLEQVAKEIEGRGGNASVVYTDHSDMNQVKRLFEQIDSENQGQLDILVNNAYAGVPSIASNSGKDFYEQPPEIWDDINNVGLRNHYFCAVYAARMMVKNQRGLIVNVSSAGGIQYFLNVAYGVGKEALDRMSADMALELKDKNVTVVSLWPGVVKTELANKYMAEKTIKATKHQDVPEEVQEKMFEKGESTEYPGIAIVALASDPNVLKLTGRCLTTADLGDKYGFTDIDGRMIVSMRSLKFVLSAGVVKIPFAETIAAWIPRFIKIPGWLIAATISRL